MDLVTVYKDMKQTYDQFQSNRLAGLPFVAERVRADKLEAVFNERMKALPRADQMVIINQLVAEGHISEEFRDCMDTFDGTWGGIKYDYHFMAGKAIEGLDPKLSRKDMLDWVSHNIKHMGVSYDDFHKIMAEARHILKMG